MAGIIFTDISGRKLDLDKEIVRELQNGRDILMNKGRETVAISPKELAFVECISCKFPVGKIGGEGDHIGRILGEGYKVVVYCLWCNSCMFVKKESLNRVYKKPGNHLKDKTNSKRVRKRHLFI